MIKAQELRIGNWVYYEDERHVITEISENFVKIKIGDTDDYEDYNVHIYPIPLTPEILEACGFYGKYKSAHTHWNYFGFGLDQKSDIDDDDNQIPEENVFYYDYKLEVKFLHQLQNLYYALTGNEITYNPK